MTAPITKSGISADDGKKITIEASTWSGTPYDLIGPRSSKKIGGDCSGTTWRIYAAVGFPYDYKPAAAFAAYAKMTGRFRELQAGEAEQDGDVLSWHNHMAIRSTFSTPQEQNFRTTQRTNRAGHKWTQINDIWTATHAPSATQLVGHPYEPFEMKWFRPDKPRVFRYVKSDQIVSNIDAALSRFPISG